MTIWSRNNCIVDDVFKALADPTRRRLLDALRNKDGQTLGALEEGLEMSRFGVMKHLAVLEEAGLISTRRDGRFKYHYLNAAPIQELADRWIAPYQKPFARLALDLKYQLEGERKKMTDRPDFVLVTFIKASQDALWDALVNPDRTRSYYYGAALESELKIGGPFRYRDGNGGIMVDGELLELTPKSRIVSSFVPTWVPDAVKTRVIFQIEPLGEVCKFTITHEDYAAAMAGVDIGWALIASGLKTLLETGQPMPATAAM